MRARCSGFIAAALLCISPAQAADRSVEPIVSHIKRQPVASTALAAVGYSERSDTLEIEFHNGRIYRYMEVPLPVYREFMAAESRRRFYHSKVRGKYRALRVKSKCTR